MCFITSCTLVEQYLPMLGLGEKPGEQPCTHEYEAVLTDPTCTAKGYTTYTCKLCMDSYVADETAMLAHDFKDGVCSCGATDPDYVPPCEHDWVAPTCTADGYCSKCQAEGTKANGHSFSEGTCSACGEPDPNYVPPCEHDWVAPTCTADGYCSKCQEKGEAMLAHKDTDGDFACDGCGTYCIPDTHEEVSYSLNISDLETGTLSEDAINSVFTILSGSEIRNRSKTYDGVAYAKSVKIGNSATKIQVAVPGNGKLSFLVQNGSSGVEMQFITVTAPDGTVHNIEFVGAVESNPVVKIELEVTEGTWIISRGQNSGTQDVFALWLNCVVEKSDENGFQLVSDGKVDYLVGDGLDFTGIRLNATFSNGKTEPLSLENVGIDASAVNPFEEGTYPVVITYKEYDAITIYVNIYAPESIELGFDAIEKIANNSYGNGVYFNHSFRELYFVGDTFSTKGLTVTVVGKCGEKTLEFVIEEYTVSGYDATYADYLTLIVETNGLTAEIEVDMTDVTPTPDEDGVYKLLVDPDYEGLGGVISGPYHTFNTIQKALDFAARIEASSAKELYIAPGYYNEKLEITVPNLHIFGMGETADEVVIEWNSIYGQLDASGFSHVTDSTATVAVREGAYNVTMENITISNYWNSQQRMDEAGLEVERALALLVQADRFVMKDSKLLGIQDTLELFTGRQYFENVFISGYTDFIFGTNNTTLFKGCTIHVIDTTKDDNGTAGYITAFKGSNKGANDSVVYGAIFDGCKFTADAGVTLGCTAIGRTWAAYSAVAVINSELGGHISLAGYSGGKNERYIAMNGKPTDATVNFVEFGNTGAGALTEAVAGMRFLSAEEAALYTNMAVIFGTVNGNVTYLDAWLPDSAPVQDDRTYYYFNGVEGSSGTSYTYTDNIQGTIVEWAGLTIDATAGKLTARGSDAQFNKGAKIIFQVEGGTLVTVVSYPGYGYYTINGVAHNANDTFSMYFATATEVVIEATDTAYICQLIINPGESAPAAPTLDEIKVSGLPLNYQVGEELNLNDLLVKAYYSDHSTVVVTDYTLDTSAVNPAAAGSYNVVVTYGGKTVTVTVTFTGADAPADFTVTFGSEGNYKDSGIDFSNIQVADNGADKAQVKEGYFSFDVKAGAVVTIKGHPGYTSYTLGDGTMTTDEITDELYTYTATADATITITPVNGGNNYFYYLSVVYPVEKEAVDFTVTFGSEGNYKDSGIDFSNIQVADNGADKAQVKEGYFSFDVKAGAVVTIKGHPGYTSYTLGDGTMTTDEITDELYTYTATADATITITPVNGGNNYFYYLSVVYPANEEPTPDEPTVPTNVVINISDLAAGTTDGGELVAGSGVSASAGLSIDGNKKTHEGLNFTQRLKLGGTMKVDGGVVKAGIEIVTEGPATITIYAISSSSSAERELQIATFDGTALTQLDTFAGVSGGSVVTVVFTVDEAGTYYIGSVSSGVNIYYIEITY